MNEVVYLVIDETSEISPRVIRTVEEAELVSEYESIIVSNQKVA